LPAALSATEIDELRTETLAVCRGQRGAISGIEPSAAGEPDEVVVRRYACIHFPHKVSRLMHQMLAHPVVVSALTGVIGADVKAMQSMLFTKGEGKPDQAWHQDEFFIPTRDRSLTAAWIALDLINAAITMRPGPAAVSTAAAQAVRPSLSRDANRPPAH